MAAQENLKRARRRARRRLLSEATPSPESSASPTNSSSQNSTSSASATSWMAPVPAPATAPELPPELMTPIVEGVEGPYVDRSIGIWEEAPLCDDIRPTKEMGASKLKLGIKNYTSKQVWAGYTGKTPMRSMIWSARAGLGNSMQGFVCTFILSFIGGRQIIGTTGGIYGRTFETALLGFEFDVDFMEKSVPRVPPVERGKTLPRDPTAIFQSLPKGFCDNTWYTPKVRACVYQAFKCRDVWCVRARSINFMLGRPRLSLGKGVLRVLDFDPPRNRFLIEAAVTRRRILEASLNNTVAAAPVAAGAGMVDTLNVDGSEEDPVSSVIVANETDRDPGSLDFVPRNPIEALQMEFDIAVHVRTIHKCTETFEENVPGCRENGIPGALEAVENFPEIRSALSLQRWACMSHLFGFLFNLKARRQSEQGEGYKGFFRTKVDEKELREFAHERHKKHATRPKELANSSSDPLDKYNLWRIEDAEAMGSEARREATANLSLNSEDELGRKGQLNILLATDSAVLRPLLIKYLRPFGVVTFSNVKPVHLAYYKGHQSVKLGNMAEFYLMAKSAIVLSYRLGMSSYARAAALYGNSSLIFGSEKHECKFPLEHVAAYKKFWNS